MYLGKILAEFMRDDDMGDPFFYGNYSFQVSNEAFTKWRSKTAKPEMNKFDWYAYPISNNTRPLKNYMNVD